MLELLTASPVSADEAARDAALDIRRSFIVEAPAGSGKTSLLVARYLRLLAEGDLDRPESVLAITFTRKATAELRERMMAELEGAKAARPLPPNATESDRQRHAFAAAVLERDRAQGWRLLERPGALNVRTIDGLCAEIVQSLPLLTGGSKRTPVDDATPLYELAAERTLRALSGPDRELHEALRVVLLHRDVQLADVRSLVAGMLAERELWGELLPLGEEELTDDFLDSTVRPKLEATLGRVICETLGRAQQAIPAHLLQELAGFAAQHAELPGYKDEPNPLELCHRLHESPEAHAKELERWRALLTLLVVADGNHRCKWRSGFAVNHVKVKLSKPDCEQLKRIIADLGAVAGEEALRAAHEVRGLPPAVYPEAQWQVCRALFRLLRHALVELELLFDERGECDFAALSLAARAALRSPEGPPDLASSGAGLTHLLVDELQDTSAAQFQLFELLTERFDGGSNTVFLVGDPKQSIYLFRQARVERFLRTATEGRLGDVPLSPLRLTQNFRSQGSLVGAFNEIFCRLLPQPGDSGREAADVPFVEAYPNRSATSGPAAVWHTAVLGERELSVRRENLDAMLPENTEPPSRAELLRRHRLREAALVREIVEDFVTRWLAHPANTEGKPPKMAVLCRNRSHVAAIVAELRRDRSPDGGPGPIAFRGTDLEPLHERLEVLDALALTRTLLHPADRIAALAVLRAPWCGLKTADLLALTGDDSEEDAKATVAELVERNATRLSGDGRDQLTRVWPTLEAAAAEAGRLPWSALVERTWAALGGNTGLSEDRRENVRSFLRLLRALEVDRAPPDVAVLERRLKTLYAAPRPEGDLEITTIHKAKGREWNLVIVPGLEQKPRGNTSELLQWMELEQPASEAATGTEVRAEVILAPIAAKGDGKGVLSRWLTGLESAREAAERKRLFYVACTRAREELHLIGAAVRDKEGALAASEANSLLRTAWPYAEQVFAKQPAEERFSALETTETSVHRGLHVVGGSGRRRISSEEIDFEGEPLALAAAAGEVAVPLIYRLPASVRPALIAPSSANRAPAEPRPSGGFAVRAFGNVAHRFLHHVANRLAGGASADELLAELPTWAPRLTASLRGEGMSPSTAIREADRVRHALEATLQDPAGRWILSPHPGAASERPLAVAHSGTIRADRVFIAGPEPLTHAQTDAQDTPCLWIIDFKTTDPGGRPTAALEAELRSRHQPQLAGYAAIYHAVMRKQVELPIRLGLYLPLACRLIHWTADLVPPWLHP